MLASRGNHNLGSSFLDFFWPNGFISGLRGEPDRRLCFLLASLWSAVPQADVETEEPTRR